MSDYLIVRLLAIRGKRMSNCQCQWCGRSYNPYGDGMMHREKLDFCSERCRHEAKSSGWKSTAEKVRADVAKMRASRTIEQIGRDRLEERFEEIWWYNILPIVALCVSLYYILYDPHFFLHLKWPSNGKWSNFVPTLLITMSLVLPLIYFALAIILCPVYAILKWIFMAFVK